MTHLNKSILSQQLIEKVTSQLAIDRDGPHGIQHGARVYSNGMYLARTTGANHKVIQLFALFHDSKRITEGSDPALSGCDDIEAGIRIIIDGTVVDATLTGLLNQKTSIEARLIARIKQGAMGHE